MLTPAESFFDYSTHGFIIPLQIEGIKMYASVNKEMVYEDKLVETGSYYIYLLHPTQGSCTFNIEQDGKSQWQSKDAPSFITSHLIDEIGAAVTAD